MVAEPQSQDLRAATDTLFARRVEPGRALADSSEDVARTCHAMALRFHRGGKVIVFGNGAASTDSLHISVEFVHPVIVGKRALPGLSLTNDVATLTGIAEREGFAEVYARQVRQLGHADDIAFGVSLGGDSENVLRGLAVGHELGLLTIALTGAAGGAIAASPDVDHALVVGSEDPLVAKEVQVTLYHILWELVHVFFEQPGVLEPTIVRSW
ncbi:MAG: D-sedoheptulose-7-phosphate isomerase [Marmoricola sp.]